MFSSTNYGVLDFIPSPVPLEHLHLIDMHFVLHKQFIGCMHTTGIASKHFRTTSSQSVPSCHKSIVSVG